MAEEVNTELDVRENTETESLDFNAELEARRRAFIKSLRKNAFRKVSVDHRSNLYGAPAIVRLTVSSPSDSLELLFKNVYTSHELVWVGVSSLGRVLQFG